MATSFTLALTRKIASKSSNMLDTFCEMDIDGDGSISRSDLAQSLKRMFNISLTNSQLNALCVKFGFTRMNRRVNYNMFVDTVRDLATATSPLTSASYGSGTGLEIGGDLDYGRLGIIRVPENVTKRELEHVIARKIRSRAATSGSSTQTFLSIDTSRDGKISIDEFREFLRNIGLEVPTAKCEEVLEDYLTSAKTVNMSSFAKFITSLAPSRELQAWEKLDEESAKRERQVAQGMARNSRIAMEEAVRKCVDDAMTDHKLLETLGETLLFKRTTLVKAFKKFDTDNDGKISREEFASGLKSCGLDISDDRAGDLIDKFDRNGNGQLASWEFIRMMGTGDAPSEAEVEASLPGTVDASTAANLFVAGDETEEAQKEIEAKLVPDEATILLNFKSALQEEQRKLRGTFLRIAGGNKSISADDLKTGLTDLGCSIDGAAAQRIVEKFDLDGSGELKFFEFLRMMNDL